MPVPEIAECLSADSLKYMKVGDFDGVLPNRRDDCFARFDLDHIYPPEQFGIKTNVPSDRE